MKSGHIALRRVLHYALYVLRIMYGVVHQPHTPAVAVLRASEIDRIALHHLPHKDAIVAIDCINPLAPLDVAGSIAPLHGGRHGCALARRTHKDDHTHTQYQDDSR